MRAHIDHKFLRKSAECGQEKDDNMALVLHILRDLTLAVFDRCVPVGYY